MGLSGAALLRVPGFRRLTLSVLFHAAGMLGEQVALGWLTLELTDSPLWVGVALGVRMAPLLLVGLPAGMLADRGDRVELLRGANAGMALATAALGLLAVLRLAALPLVLAVTFVVGCGRALQQVAQQTHAHDLVGAPQLIEALSGIGIATRVGGLAGALAAGAILARFGSGATYLGIAGAYALSALALPRPRSAEPAGTVSSGAAAPARPRPVLPGLWATLRASPALPVLIGLTAAAEVLGFSHQTVLPSLARDVLRVGPDGLGAMTAARQLGGVLGIAAGGLLGHAVGPGRLFPGVLGAFGLSVAVLGLAPGYGTVLVLLVAANATGALADVLGQGLVQRSVPAEFRGRASGAWVVAIGVAPIGHLQIGALASWIGVAPGLGLSGTALAGLAALAAVRAPRLRRL